MIVLDKPRHWANETFRGPVVFDYDDTGKNSSYRDCIFDALGEERAIIVPPDRKPRANIVATVPGGSRIFGSSGKLVLGRFLAFQGPVWFRDAPDGVFAQAGDIMAIHMDGVDIDLRANLPEHCDPFQTTGGGYCLIRNSKLKVRGTGGNSCVYLESLAPPVGSGPVSRVRLVNNVFDGGGYCVWCLEDPNRPGGPLRDVVIADNVFKNWIFGRPIMWTEGSKPVMVGNVDGDLNPIRL